MTVYGRIVLVYMVGLKEEVATTQGYKTGKGKNKAREPRYNTFGDLGQEMGPVWTVTPV